MDSNRTIELEGPPRGYERKFKTLFTPEAVNFLVDLVSTFQFRTNEILRTRKVKKLSLNQSGKLPTFSLAKEILGDWKVGPIPVKLINRHLDLGDVSPSNVEHLKAALKSKAQGIQIDYDDGHCPTWTNMIEGIYNVVAFSRGEFCSSEVPKLEDAPVLLLRPRAWNMNEHNIMVNGREIPGPLMDFGLLIFHTGKKFASLGIGPFFYLSKVEGANEAKLWNDIFVWAQNQLGIPNGTIKACVLIENILASFEMEEILYELRDHSIGLNCGIWDYAASFVNKFGERKQFLLPDRNKYVNMDKHFLASYMRLVVQTCHRRGAHATGGMAALTIDSSNRHKKMDIIENVCKAKLREIHTGIDGFLVYDPELVSWMNDLWDKFGSEQGPNQIKSVSLANITITPNDLLQIPQGGVTIDGLRKNVKVGILFIYSWIAKGQGHFILDGAVEDSATAEISRSQIWQWIFHQEALEDHTKETITKSLVTLMTWDFFEKNKFAGKYSHDLLKKSCQMLLEIVTSFEFPEFITTFLYNHSNFRESQLV